MIRPSAFQTHSLTLAVGAALCLAALSSRAVSVDPDGYGQVLLFPYYTVNGGKQSVVSVTNSDTRAKALRVRFREALDGRAVLEFNLYLDAADTWTAAVFTAGDAARPAALLTRDTACTVPPIRTNAALATTADGDRYVDFRNFGYSGAGADGGPTDLARTREGFFEIIEMGTLRPDSPSARAAVLRDGVPSDCRTLEVASMPGGYWSADPARDVDAPRGGVTGYAAIVDVASGTSYAVTPTALADFRDAPLHALFFGSQPTLADARSAPDGTAVATVRSDGRTIASTYPADRAIDAVSAALQSDDVANEFVRDAALGARTDWVVAFPTRQFYSDRAIVGTNALAPFTSAYWGAVREPAASCERAGLVARDRDGRLLEHFPAGPCVTPSGECPPLPAEVSLCAQVAVVGFGASGPLDSTQGPAIDRLRPVASGGYAQLQLDSPVAERHALRPSLEGHVHAGLPIIGFAATELVNGRLDGGTLANYADTRPNRVRRRCTRADGAACAP